MNHASTHGDSSSAADRTLRAGRLGVIGIVFFVVAAAAPLVGMTGALPAAIALGNGAAAPGAYLAAGLTLLLFSVGYAAMSHRVTNAGAFFAYIGRGLGPAMGIGAAFTSLLAYLAIHLSLFGFFGGLLAEQLGLLPWWAWSGLAWLAITWLSLRSVDLGAGLLGILLSLELLSLLITAAAIFVHGGPEGVNLGASFAPERIFAGGLAGSAGIALAFAFASFIGFEATAIYGEESLDPKRTVPLATYTAVLLITAVFAFTSFAIVTGLGASRATEQVLQMSSVDGTPLVNPAAVLFGLASTHVGPWLANTMQVLVLSSLFAGLLAFQNSAARYLFALGRTGTLPAGLAAVNALGAPARGSLTVSGLTLAVIVLFAATGLDPVLNMFFWFSGLAVVAILLIEILVCVAVIAFFHREPGDSNWFQRWLAPVLAMLGLCVAEYLLMSRFGLLTGAVAEGVDPAATAWRLSPLGWALLSLPFVAGAVGLVFARVRHRQTSDMVRDMVG